MCDVSSSSEGGDGSPEAVARAALRAIVQHPVVTVAREITRPDSVEKWAITPKDALRLEGAILEHLQDPLMPGVIRALFGMVATLHQAEGSPTAARTLVTILARVEPQLRALWRVDGTTNHDTSAGKPTVAEQAEQRSRSLVGASAANASAARSSAPPPDGAIAVRALHIPEPPRPTHRPRAGAGVGLGAGPPPARPVRGSSRPRPQPRFLRDDASE